MLLRQLQCEITIIIYVTCGGRRLVHVRVSIKECEKYVRYVLSRNKRVWSESNFFFKILVDIMAAVVVSVKS